MRYDESTTLSDREGAEEYSVDGSFQVLKSKLSEKGINLNLEDKKYKKPRNSKIKPKKNTITIPSTYSSQRECLEHLRSIFEQLDTIPKATKSVETARARFKFTKFWKTSSVK